MKMVHLLITRHGDVWRVRILIPGESRPRWRAYRLTDYPTPEAVARRCASGLCAGKEHGENEHHHERKQQTTHVSLHVRWEFWMHMF